MTSKEAVKQFEPIVARIKEEYPESDVFVDAATILGVEIVSKTLKERKEIEAKIIDYVDNFMSHYFMYVMITNAISACKTHKAKVKQIYQYA